MPQPIDGNLNGVASVSGRLSERTVMVAVRAGLEWLFVLFVLVASIGGAY